MVIVIIELRICFNRNHFRGNERDTKQRENE